jgi:hypothetical protein
MTKVVATKMVAAIGPRVSDHALLRILERSGIDIEGVRSAVADALARSHALAESLGTSDHLITVDGLTFVVRGGTVTTVIRSRGPQDRAIALANDSGGGGRG